MATVGFEPGTSWSYLSETSKYHQISSHHITFGHAMPLSSKGCIPYCYSTTKERHHVISEQDTFKCLTNPISLITLLRYQHILCNTTSNMCIRKCISTRKWENIDFLQKSTDCEVETSCYVSILQNKHSVWLIFQHDNWIIYDVLLRDGLWWSCSWC
jgi:hypothetical protein